MSLPTHVTESYVEFVSPPNDWTSEALLSKVKSAFLENRVPDVRIESLYDRENLEFVQHLFGRAYHNDRLEYSALSHPAYRIVSEECEKRYQRAMAAKTDTYMSDIYPPVKAIFDRVLNLIPLFKVEKMEEPIDETGSFYIADYNLG